MTGRSPSPSAEPVVALLRAVNVAGHGAVSMKDLSALLSGLGFTEPRTLLQSGNLLFRTGETAGPELERRLEEETERRLGLGTVFMVRTAAEWKALVAANPFPVEAERDPGHLVVLFFKDAPAPKALASLRASISGREILKPGGRQAFVHYPDGIGRSRLTTALVERHLETRATGRNWNTVLRIAALLEG